MGDPAADLAPLARIYLQGFLIALLFAGTGDFIVRRISAARTSSEPDNAAWRWAQGYFVGACAFLACFVPLSRLVGAFPGLLICLVAMAAASLETARNTAKPGAVRTAVRIMAVIAALVAFYTLSNWALWMIRAREPWFEPHLFTHYGSIHAGRYANYALYIADFARVPYLAQNAGQSILASLHLLLGVHSPLAALMAWIPLSLAFLSLLFYGLFRLAGFGRGHCVAAAFFVMFCNVAISAVHVLVFDNGSPLAFIGYTDLVLATATFVLLCRWLQRLALEPASARWRSMLLPLLLALNWAWYAPQNLVVATLGLGGAALWWAWKQPSTELRRALGRAALAWIVGCALGALQLGPLLPKALRDDTGLWMQEVEGSLSVRPYTQYLRGHWSTFHWNVEAGKVQLEHHPYERIYEHAREVGPDEVYRDVGWFAEDQLWGSLRVYGYPILGLLLFGATIRRRGPAAASTPDRLWLALSGGAFVAGYAIAFLVELGDMKWWLTRFLVPGSALGLACLGFFALRGLSSTAPRWQAIAAGALLVLGVIGPLVELASAAHRNVSIEGKVNPLERRLHLLVASRGPWLFEGLSPNPAVARRAGYHRVSVGDERSEGLAVSTPAIMFTPGKRRVGFRIELTRAPSPGSALFDIDVEAGPGSVKKTVTPADLEKRPDGSWAWADFEISTETAVTIRLRHRAGTRYDVTDLRVERR